MTAKALCDRPALVRPADLVCTCMLADPHELLSEFALRWRRVGPRLARHGHPVNAARLIETMRLIGRIDGGHQEAFAVENWGRAHHRPACPFSSRQNPLSTIDTRQEARWVSP